GGRLLALQERLLSLAQDGSELDSAREERQAEGPVPFLEGKDAGVVIDRRRLETGVHPGRDLESRTGPCDRTDGEIRGETEPLAHLLIAGVLDFQLVGRADRSCRVGGELASAGKRFEGGLDLRDLLRGRGQLANHRSD